MIDEVEVTVQIDGLDVAAGMLWMHQRRRLESATFAYHASYLQRPGAYPLDPELPLLSGQQHTPPGRALFGAFSDSAPDGWGRRLIARAERAATGREGRASRDPGEATFLLGVRDDMRQGALRYRRPGGPFLAGDRTEVPPLIRLATLLNASLALEADTATSRDLDLLLHGGSSLGGARPKAHVLDADGRASIAKFPSPRRDEWDVIRWEATVLTLAGSAGLAVAGSRLHQIEGRPVLVVERFDRGDAASRVGYASALTMLSSFDGQTHDYLDLAEVIEEESPAPSRDLRELWSRCVFGRLIRNTDDHMRNHAFLRRGSGWELSPMFDINPNPSRGAFATSFAGDEGGELAPLIEHAELFRLSPREAVARLVQLDAAVSQWQPVARAHGIAQREIDEMLPAFENRTVDAARDYVSEYDRRRGVT